MPNVLNLPVAPNYEPITKALNDEELIAIAEALSYVAKSSAENERLRIAIVRELSIREASFRGSRRRHPSGHS